MSIEERLSPNYDKLADALRSIGYSFEAAVADVIDNAIDAKAELVLVRLIAKRCGQLDLAIWDDGIGMDRSTLVEAMRFGADVSNEIQRLGKFGLGLKLASLSQARAVYVISAREGKISGMAWLEHGIASEFKCTIFNTDECVNLASQIIPDRSLKPHGTLVWWSDLYRVGQHLASSEEHAQKLLKKLEMHLSMAFHRFLSGRTRRVRIELDIMDDVGRPGIQRELDPLDPFGYEQSGSSQFPAQMIVEGRYRDQIQIYAHIWPPDSKSPAYKLPGGAVSRQGFYFYRNDRLIQAGGWNGMREKEPHFSLARLAIDLDPSLDVDISLDVKKVAIQLPSDLSRAMERAKTESEIDFKRYLSIADKVYRKRKATQSDLPLIPSTGMPAELSRFLHDELRIKATKKHRDLRIVWERFDRGSFFKVNREDGVLYLNSIFRKQLLHGFKGSQADLPVVKCLLFLVLEDMFLSERVSAKSRERMEQVNRILVQAVKHERSRR